MLIRTLAGATPGTRLLLLAALLLGLAAGAYARWRLWLPIDALPATLGAGLLLLLGVLLAIRGRRAPRIAGLALAAFGLGVLVGQQVGPARPALALSEGELTVLVERPVEAQGSIVATCQAAMPGPDLQVSGDPDLRVDLLPDDPSAPADVDQREFLGISVFVGDRWRDGRVSRSDDIDLLVIIGQVRAEALEVRLAADDGSALDLELDERGGSLRFAELVDVSEVPGAAGGAPQLLELAGTIRWTCGG